MTENEARARINLALSLLNHRRPSGDVIDLAVMALRGATVGELAKVDGDMRGAA